MEAQPAQISPNPGRLWNTQFFLFLSVTAMYLVGDETTQSL